MQMRRQASFAAGVLISFTASIAGANPTVFWASDPVRPDDTVLVAGDDFGMEPIVWLLPLTDGAGGDFNEVVSWPEDQAGFQIEALQATNESLKFTVPATLKQSAWLFRIETSAGLFSQPERLNGPTVYWMQGDMGLRSVAPGGWLRVMGRSVGWPEMVGQVRLKRSGHQQRVDLQPVDVSLWSIKVDIPEYLESGIWTVFLHNGLGGEQGWTRAGEVTIAIPQAWPEQFFDVRDFGATGRDPLLDGLAIEAALAKARTAGGGVVQLPRGRYRLDRTLVIPPFTVLRGESTKLVSLFWPDTDTPYTLVEGTHHFGLEDLTLYASNHTHVIAGSTGQPDSGHTFVRRVRVRADMYRGHLDPSEVDRRFRASLKLSSGGGDTIRLGGPDVEVSDCDLYGSGRSIYLEKARGARVVNNRLYNGRWGWYSFSGSDGLIFENNTLTGADLMSTGGGINNLDGGTSSRNVYYANNTLSLMHGWDREAMTSDAGGGTYHGGLTSVAPDTVRLVIDKPVWHGGPKRWEGATLFILGGHGMGQFRTVLRIADDQRTITLEHPLDVQPDPTTLATITQTQQNYLFINNRFADTGIAVQYYGTTINCVAAGNTSTRAGGFYNSGRWYHGYQPSWYCQFLENEILEGNGYRFGPNISQQAGDSFLGTWGLQRGNNTAPLAYCGVHRRNRLHNNAFISLKGVSREHPGLRDVVVEHNTIENSQFGIRMDDGCVGVLLRKNAFHQVEYELLDTPRLRRMLTVERAKLVGGKNPAYYLSFDRKNGRLFPDDSGNNLQAMETIGPVALVDGIAGQAGRFDGTSYLSVFDHRLLDFPLVTISAWVRPDYDHGRWGVVSRRTKTGSAPYVLAVHGSDIEFNATDTTGDWSYNKISSGSNLKPQQWNHVAVTCEDGNQVLLYCNGRQVGQKTIARERVQEETTFRIGYEAWGGKEANGKTSGNFEGLIDEVKIWSRILTPEEISQEYKALEVTN